MSDQKPFSVVKAVCAGGIGNIVEWYSFMVYAYLTPQIATVFFPEEHPQKARILSLLIFAVGFLARPLSAVLYGYIGDYWGRRKALLSSQYLMAISTLLLSILPTYATWGPLAAILLTVLRIIQGFSIAGEYTTSLCYFAEVSPLSQRGLWVSSISASTAVGILFSAIVVFIFTNILTSLQLLIWGWRLCFFGGFVLSLTYNIPYAIVGGLTPVFLSIIYEHYALIGTAYVTITLFAIALIATFYS